MAFLRQLHAELETVARPTMTCHELASWAASRLAAAGFVNLDFRGNVGHRLGRPRAFIEAGNETPLGELGLFTFEPHVRAARGTWGLKHEDVFYFDTSGRLTVL